jgi:hypothetical protein
MSRTKLTKRAIDAQKPARDRYTVWDTHVSGFGVRIMPGGDRVYVLKYRIGGEQRWLTIGRHGSPWTPEMARKQAVQLLGEIAKGSDPADRRAADRRSITMAQLCDLYMAKASPIKRLRRLKSTVGVSSIT